MQVRPFGRLTAVLEPSFSRESHFRPIELLRLLAQRDVLVDLNLKIHEGTPSLRAPVDVPTTIEFGGVCLDLIRRRADRRPSTDHRAEETRQETERDCLRQAHSYPERPSGFARRAASSTDTGSSGTRSPSASRALTNAP